MSKFVKQVVDDPLELLQDLNQKALTYRHSEIDKMVHMAQQALELAKQYLNNPQNLILKHPPKEAVLAEALDKVSLAPQSAKVRVLSHRLEEYHQAIEQEKAKSLGYLAEGYGQMGYFEKAIAYALEGFELTKSHQLIDSQLQCLNALGRSYGNLLMLQEALEVLQKAQKLAQSHHALEAEGLALLEMAEVYHLLEDYQEGIAYSISGS
ncbi:MAG: hypothetical protein R2865_12485 [Deinococcales bacterium]